MGYKFNIITGETLSSNNFEKFNSILNDYIKAQISWKLSNDTGGLIPDFIKIIIPSSDYFDISDNKDIHDYQRLENTLIILSLIDSNTFHLNNGWTASNLIYEPINEYCSVILSRSDFRKISATNLVSLLLEVVTFGKINSIKIIFELYNENYDLIYQGNLEFKKDFFSSIKPIIFANKYSLRKNETVSIYANEMKDGINKQVLGEARLSNTPYLVCERDNAQPFTLFLRPPQIYNFEMITNSNKIIFEAAFCNKIYYYNKLQTSFLSYNLIDITGYKEYQYDSNKLYHWFRFEGYSQYIEKVIYDTKLCNVNDYVFKLVQTSYLFIDSGMRIMRLEWEQKKDFKFRVIGTPLSIGYLIDTKNRNSWEFPFQYAQEDYWEIQLISTGLEDIKTLLTLTL